MTTIGFTERYTTVVASTGHLSLMDFARLNASAWQDMFSRVAKRPTGYFIKLWESMDEAKCSALYSSVSQHAQRIIDEAIAAGAQCLELDADATDGFDLPGGLQ